MLDQETKRRIDTARDILVGKLPNPQAQVEQITIAMIYKFMDDMDKEAMEFGGEATFFTGEFEKYSWTKIFDPKLGGFEMLALYGEAIVKLNQNPNIPQLFRDIFKNAFLPYRDPETLKLFLKTINEFTYDHSEKLGDAFEYLLSVLGSQGDAGQFRTPRHIIDFIVSIVQPKKEETICDPACGTAGFLISAYKHILAENTQKTKGDLLTPDDRKKLINNFTGYDISAEMVRLSLVNLYLHGFATPKIYEYDTLTSEERWGDYFDIILANPPFMTPKGGIRPHKKFAMQANRSEVLFVDYIMEHINPTTGRAAVIVPEGIIFQSAGAYKELRKALVEKNYLYGVVSLPAGIFQPYSGVKTSILLLDKTLAKKTDKILFVKIENDGFSLGAQRKEISQNDLPDAANLIKQYMAAVKNDDWSLIDFESLPMNFSLAEKNSIRQGGDYNLSGERYRTTTKKQHKYSMVNLGDAELFHIESGGTPDTSNSDYWNGDIKWATLVDLPASDLITKLKDTQRKISEAGLKNSSAKLLPVKSILVSSRATIGRVAINESEVATNQGFKNIVIKDGTRAMPEFVALMATQLKEKMERLASGGTFKEISKANFCTLEIPLPPLSVQQEIVAKIEQYEKIIAGAKQVIKNYKPQIDIHPDWEMVELGSVCEINPKKSEIQNREDGFVVSFVPMADMNENSDEFIPQEEKNINDVYNGYTYFKDNDVLLAKVTPCFENGKAGIAKNLKNSIGFGSSEFIVLRSSEKVLPLWLYLNVTSPRFKELGKARMTGTGGLQRVPRDFVAAYPIPLPSLAVQQVVISEIENEKQLVNSNKELVNLFEQKITAEMAKLWEE